MKIRRGLSVANFVLASYSDGAASSPHRFMSEHDVLRFFANVTLFDGSVEPNLVYLTVGCFGARSGERLPIDVYDKVALYIILAAKYGVGVKGIYVREGWAEIHLDRGYAARAFAAEWPFFSQMLREGKALGTSADHVIKKLGKMERLVEELAERIRIEHELREEGGKPKLVVRFKDGAGNVLAYINVRWDGRRLHADFNGAKENAERLASILSALGAEVEARQYGKEWARGADHRLHHGHPPRGVAGGGEGSCGGASPTRRDKQREERRAD
ncbi:PaRep2b protein [Pyrobaculum sp.]|uniref:PaRep2b protein n=1 Tax=Pyrobaculum sp. TaxID=2004705 RepID=UPI0031627374